MAEDDDDKMFLFSDWDEEDDVTTKNYRIASEEDVWRFLSDFSQEKDDPL